MRSAQTQSKSSSQSLSQPEKRAASRPTRSRAVSRNSKVNIKASVAKTNSHLNSAHDTSPEHLQESGPLYDPLRLRWPEMAEYAFSHFGHELRLFREQVTTQELEIVSQGRVEFSLLHGSSVLFLLYRIHPTEAWSYVPVSWWLLCNKQRTRPSDYEPDPVITVSLINARNGRICSKRDCHISIELNHALAVGLSEQARRPYDFLEMSQQLQLAYSSQNLLATHEQTTMNPDVMRREALRLL